MGLVVLLTSTVFCPLYVVVVHCVIFFLLLGLVELRVLMRCRLVGSFRDGNFRACGRLEMFLGL